MTGNVHVGRPVGVALIALDGPLDRREQGLRLDEEREEVAVHGADGGTAVLELVFTVRELLDVPLPEGAVGRGRTGVREDVSNRGGRETGLCVLTTEGSTPFGSL